MTRGLKINNPGNIRIGQPLFHNEISPGSDDEFREFSAPEDGIRAMAKVLLTYFYKYKLNTIRGIINRWAPPTENDTTSYIRTISDQTLFGIDEPIDLENKDIMAQMIEAIIHHEQGVCPYSMAQVDTGVSEAYA